MNVVAVGDNCLDVYVAQGLLSVGGNALNVAAQLKTQGLEAAYLGAIGTDQAANVVSEGLSEVGLDPDNLSVEDGTTGVTLIELVAQERHFLHESFGVGETWIPDFSHTDIAKASWVHVAGTTSEIDVAAALVSREHRVSLDLSTRHTQHQDLSGIEVVFASHDGDGASAIEIGRRLVNAGAESAVIMCGPQGSVAIQGKDIVRQQAQSIAPVDTLGAGDSFIAGYIAGRLHGESISSAMSRGTDLATRTCMDIGGFPQGKKAIPEWLMEEYGKYL